MDELAALCGFFGRGLWFVLVAGVLLSRTLAAQEDDDTFDAQPAAGTMLESPLIDKDAGQLPDRAERGVLNLIQNSGPIGLVIICLSVAALSLILEHMITIRRGNLLPRGLAEDLRTQVAEGDYAKAEQACKLRPSYLSYVVLTGLQEVRFGYAAVEKAMEDASQAQAARLFRKVEYLALIGNISPMLGLLGTVYGLVLAFKKVAETKGAALAADLADGIYLALMTTVMGLVVAIPALSSNAIFRSRIEHLASEVAVLAERIFLSYKRDRVGRREEHQTTPPATRKRVAGQFEN